MMGRLKRATKKEIKHTKIQIDPKIVNNRYLADCSQRFSYFAYHVDGEFEPDKKTEYNEIPTSERSSFYKSDICFAGLGRLLHVGKTTMYQQIAN